MIPSTLQVMVATVKVVFPRVETFSSAAEFLAAYRPDRPGCLVLDVGMRGMSGLELQRRLIHDKIALPVIFVTSSRQRGDGGGSDADGGRSFSGEARQGTATLGEHPQGVRFRRTNPPPLGPPTTRRRAALPDSRPENARCSTSFSKAR